MTWFVAATGLLVACFGFVLLFGPPYLPTLNRQVVAALDMVDLGPGNTLLELGCGDGRVLLAAAERGWKVVGYELNPLLAAVAWLRTRRYGRQVRVICGNFWAVRWPPAEGIFVFLLQRQMNKLDTKIIQECHRPVKLVSFAFTVPGKQPVRQASGIYLYEYR